MERFREGIAEAFPWPQSFAKTIPDETIVCRCEGITARELRDVALEKTAHELNRAKAFSRVGMGRCQGRYCGHAAAEIVSAAIGAPLETIGRLRGQAPVKPLAVSTPERLDMSQAARSDVIVIGGGIMGAATAFFLRQRGLSVTLIERGLIGQQASGTNFGNVRRQGRYLRQLPLANRSRQIWGKLDELLGEDVEFLATGHIRVTYNDETIANFEDYAREARHYGLDLEIISGNALRDRFPFIGPEVRAGSYSPRDGHANPRLVAPAFGRAAKRAGAAVLENTEIVVVEKDGGEFRVEAADGRVFRAPQLMISAGAWANRLATQFGEPVPLVAHGPQMAVTEPLPYAIQPVLGVCDRHSA